MKVRGTTRSENIIDGSFTTAELSAVIRATLNVPQGAQIGFYVTDDGTDHPVDDLTPVCFTIRWAATQNADETVIPAVSVIERAARPIRPDPAPPRPPISDDTARMAREHEADRIHPNR